MVPPPPASPGRHPTPHGELLDAALDYAARGWPVFPVAGVAAPGVCACRDGANCGHAGKHPLTRRGLREATCSASRILGWWRSWPAANVAVATGAAAGIVVVDVDLPKGGEESLGVLSEGGLVLPATLTARTGGGGLHLFYAHPGRESRNRAGGLPGAGALRGIDLRGDGGYVVAAPSAHASGARYEWVDPAVPVAAWPPWMVEQRRQAPDGPRGVREPVRGGSRYGLTALQAETAAVRRAEVGERNNRLNQAAWSLGMLVGGGELEEHVVIAELQAAGAAAGLDEAETAATIASGLSAGVKRPRRRPEAPAQRPAPPPSPRRGR